MPDPSRLRIERIWALDGLIRAGKYPDCSSFAREWRDRCGYEKALDRRTIHRDIDWLRTFLKAPIAWSGARRGYYYTDPSWVLPSALPMGEDELTGLLLAGRAAELFAETGLASSLDALFTKLSLAASRRSGRGPEDMRRLFSFHSLPNRPVRPEIWQTVTTALLARRVLHLDYAGSPVKAASERSVLPLHLANLGGEWYLAAHCRLRGSIRQFALSRIRSACDTGESFEYPADFDPQAYLRNRFERYLADPGEPVHRVTVRIPAEAAEWALERAWHPGQEIVRRRDGSVRLTVPMPSLWEACRWVLAWGGAAEVLAPKALRELVAEEVERMGRFYALRRVSKKK